MACGTTCVVPLLPRFRNRYPGDKRELLFSDQRLDLVEERIDLGFRLGPNLDSDMVGVKLMNTRCFVCASSAYLKLRKGPRSPEDSRDHKCLLFALAD